MMRIQSTLLSVFLVAVMCPAVYGQETEPAGQPELKAWRYTLIDATANVSLEEFSLDQNDLPATGDSQWSVKMTTLQGGKQDGVRLITVSHEGLTLSLIPTRGLSLYEVNSGDMRLGWDSPVKEHVHPQYINLDSRGGLGWLDGFNEWMVRCGLEFAGHPGTDEFVTNTGDIGTMDLTLHGKVGNIPASKVEVLIEKESPHRIHVRGVVHERLFFGPKLQLTADVSTVPGETELRLLDEVTNLSATAQEMQLIYHTNYGQGVAGSGALLQKGAKVVVPVNLLAPMNEQAAKAIETWDTYQEPIPGFIEEVFLVHPYADAEGKTGVLLHNSEGNRGASIHWNVKELPYFTIWKNTVAEEDGYVTGLEPATGFPYNRKVEREAGRVPLLEPGASRQFRLDFQIHTDAESVSNAAEAVKGYQGDRKSVISTRPLME